MSAMWPKYGTVEIHKRGKRFLVRYIDQKQCRAYRTRSKRGALVFAEGFGRIIDFTKGEMK